MHQKNLPARFALLICLLAWCIVMLGAYTRLKDAGLGCPDWPGCYGQAVVPQTPAQLQIAQHNYPNQPVEAAKAWPEMIHRYFVGILGLGIILLSILSYRKRHQDKTIFKLALAIIGVILFQALLGKWTVTLQLLPTVVMGHLLGGMTLLTLLWLMFLKFSHWQPTFNPADQSIRTWGVIGLTLIALQIFLGGWTSANNAALVCPDFPLCRGQLIPALDFKHAFDFFLSSGSHISESARITIQWMHRLGGLIVFLYITALSIRCMLAKTGNIRVLGILLFVVLLAQVTLGILNVLLRLPLFTAVAHNGIAAILLLCVITLLFQVFKKT